MPTTEDPSLQGSQTQGPGADLAPSCREAHLSLPARPPGSPFALSPLQTSPPRNSGPCSLGPWFSNEWHQNHLAAVKADGWPTPTPGWGLRFPFLRSTCDLPGRVSYTVRATAPRRAHLESRAGLQLGTKACPLLGPRNCLGAGRGNLPGVRRCLEWERLPHPETAGCRRAPHQSWGLSSAPQGPSACAPPELVTEAGREGGGCRGRPLQSLGFSFAPFPALWVSALRERVSPPPLLRGLE